MSAEQEDKRPALEALQTARGLLLTVVEEGARRADTRVWLALRAVERAIAAIEEGD